MNNYKAKNKFFNKFYMFDKKQFYDGLLDF